jgi:hypothetical protein
MAPEDDAPTCGKGLAANSQLPAQLAELATGLSDVLEHHMTALDQSQESGMAEYAAYESLVRQYRDISERLVKAAEEMKSDRDLPMAEHDMEVMTSAKSRDVFARYIEIKRQLSEMLKNEVEQDEHMLDQMQQR